MSIDNGYHTCPKCGQAMTTFAVLNSVQGHCTNSDCDLETVTLEIGTHELLTEAQIQQYADVKRVRAERNRVQRVLELVELFGEAGQQS